MDSKQFLKQFISSHIQGPNAEALIGTLADQADALNKTAIAVTDQLTISTASGEYLDQRLSEVGFIRPPDLGLSDEAFRRLGIEATATKQVTDIVHSVLATFYGADAVRAYAQSSSAGPYALEDGDDLIFSFESGTVYTMTFSSSDFANINQATAQEVSDAITRFILANNINAFAQVYTDYDTNLNYVRIFGSAQGPFSLVKVLGGSAQIVLNFPEIRPTELAINNTSWEITRSVGSNLRFRWNGSGTAPKLDRIAVGDIALIYGPNFAGEDQNLIGSFTITSVRPALSVAAYDAGYFECENTNVTNLKYTQPDTVPSPNGPGTTYTYTVNQALYSDIKFMFPKKNTAYSQKRYALAFESQKKKLKVYLPAVTKVVARSLIGAAHLHMLYPAADFDGSFSPVFIYNDYAIVYPQNGKDNLGSGGFLNGTIPISYANRENGYTTIVTSTPHGLVGDNQWIPTTFYSYGDQVWWAGLGYEAIPAKHGIVTVIGNGVTATATLTESVAYSVGDQVVLEDNTNVSFNGTWTITNVVGNVVDFSCAVVGSGANGTLYKKPCGVEPQNTVDWKSIGPMDNIYAGSIGISGVTVLVDDPNHSFLGAYNWNNESKYTLSSILGLSKEKVFAGENRKTLVVDGQIPNSPGYLIMDLGKDTEETAIPYVGAQVQSSAQSINIVSISQSGQTVTATLSSNHNCTPGQSVLIGGTVNFNGTHIVTSVPSSAVLQFQMPFPSFLVENTGSLTPIIAGTLTTILLDSSYQFKYNHDLLSDVTLLSSKEAYVPEPDGTDRSFYVTGTAEARVFAEDLIRSITASGINLEIVIVYPSDIGWGNYSLDKTDYPTADLQWVYGV